MTSLFTPLTLRNTVIRNRIGISPMCQYSSNDGFASDWHLAHIGARAAGGAGLIIMEATGVTPEGRITPACLGLWKDEHIDGLKRVTDFAKSQGAVIGIQLAHAGRKASMARPWDGGRRLPLDQGGWETLAPSAIPFRDGEPAPREMGIADIHLFIEQFIAAAHRAVKAGFQLIEIHAAHGYLIHEFLSPITNHRTDAYGGSRDNRFRLLLELAERLRAEMPDDIILSARLSCVDWLQGGITIEDSVAVAAELKKRGIDFIDCSSGSIAPGEKIHVGPGYQAAFAEKIRKDAGIATAAVGMITDAKQANDIIETGVADMAFIARASLKDPSWPIHAAITLGDTAPVPPQYLRGY